MRRVMAALGAVTVTVALGGCGILSWLPGPIVTAPPIAVGVCLDGMNGADSDRTSVVACEEPHLFEITAIDQWPGMADALADAGDDRGAVWDDIHLADANASGAEYGDWASRDCNEAAQRVVGISDVEVDGHTAGDLWLRVGGTYGIDFSLGSREEFAAGDVSTICSVAWYDDAGHPRMTSAPPFARLMAPGIDPELRECVTGDDRSIPCDQPHAAQLLLSFDGLVAFGPELIARVAGSGGADEDRAVADAFCEQLLLKTLPSTAGLGGLRVVAEVESRSPGWGAFEGTVDPGGGYFFSCFAAGETGETVTGDVFDGDIVLAGPVPAV